MAGGLEHFLEKVALKRMFAEEWRPDLCLMATFGQLIPRHIFEVPRLGFYNFHHSDELWPSYPGPDPITAMQRDGLKHLVLTLHKVSDVIDDGEFVARSHPVAIPARVTPIEMHRITWPQMGGFITQVVSDILNPEAIELSHDCVIHEQPLQYMAA